MNTLNYILNKYNLGINMTSPIEIPNVGRIDFIRWIRELGFTVGAEIGVDHAKFSEQMCESNPQLKLYGIDPYLKYSEYNEYKDQAEMDGIYEHAKALMAVHMKKGRYELIRKKSEDAVKDFEDESLDFVYIDANHEGDYPLEDIQMWAKKVRPGGIVAGHDYVRVKALNFTVKDALEKLAEQGLKYFVLGRYEFRDNEIRDHSRSWMFIK
jgi:SAM-dependent methyltransferase